MTDPIRKGLLPCVPPPEWEFHTVYGARTGAEGCALFPGDTGPVVVRRRVTYGDWEPVRPDRWADEPETAAVSAAAPSTDHTTPSRRAGLRDEIVKVLGQIPTIPPVAHRRAQADNVLALLYREWPWLRAEADDDELTAEIANPRTMYDAASAREHDLIEERDRLLEAQAADRAADRAAVLTEAERTMLTYALDQAQERIWSEDGFTDEDQAAVTSLRRLADEAPATTKPRRGDQFEAWLKARRDEYEVRSSEQWRALDEVLDTYRLHADTGTPLNEHACDGPHCDCPPAVVEPAEAADAEVCGAREPEPRTGTSPCVLPAGHGGTKHQDKWTNQWPTAAKEA